MEKSNSDKKKYVTKRLILTTPLKCPLSKTDWLNYLTSLRNSNHNDISLFYSQKNAWIAASVTIGALFAALFIPLVKISEYPDSYLIFVIIIIIFGMIISFKVQEKFFSKIIDHKKECRDEIDRLINSIIWGTATESNHIRALWFITMEELQKKGFEIIRELKLEEK